MNNLYNMNYIELYENCPASTARRLAAVRPTEVRH